MVVFGMVIKGKVGLEDREGGRVGDGVILGSGMDEQTGGGFRTRAILHGQATARRGLSGEFC